MAVLLADRLLGVRRQSSTGVDGHGDRIGLAWGELAGPLPGRAEQRPDTAMHATGGRTWVLALDEELWPIAQGDLAEDTGTGERWLVTSADLLVNNADPSVNYIRVEAHTYTSGGTSP